VADLNRLWKAPRLSRFFDRELELRALQAFLGGSGSTCALPQAPTCAWTTACTRKAPRAFVEPVNAPEDVRMSVKPVGAWTTTRPSSTKPAMPSLRQRDILPKELVTQGHSAPTEAFGEFFRHAFSDPRWLVRTAPSSRPGPAGAGQPGAGSDPARPCLREMMYLRRYAFAKIAYELRLHGRSSGADRARARPAARSGPGERRPPRAVPPALLRRLRFRAEPDEAQAFLTDVDETFYSADYARAFALAGMMHEGIRKRFGEDWYASPRSASSSRSSSSRRGPRWRPRTWPSGWASPRGRLRGRRGPRQRLVVEADALEKAK